MKTEIIKKRRFTRMFVQMIGFGAVLCLVPTLVSAQTFTDVPQSAWFYDDVEMLVEEGVISKSSASYRPNDNVNRAEMAKLIVEAYNIPIISVSIATFLDVSPGEWYSHYVETVALNGIVVGYKDVNGYLSNLYGPTDPITREQAAKMIVLGAELSSNTNCSEIFSDVIAAANTDTENWSYEYIMTLYAHGIIDGYSDGTFRPTANINRAEIAKILAVSLDPQMRDCAQ